MNQENMQLRNQVQDLIDAAKKYNVDAVEITASLESGFVASARQGDVENLEHHREKSITVTVYKNKCSGNASTSDFSPTALSETLAKACSIAEYIEPDPFAGLADAALMAYNYPDLELSSPWSISHEEAIELAIQCDTIARAEDKRITQTEECSVSSDIHFGVYANSHGFLGSYESTMHGLSLSLIAESKGQMERDYDYSYARFSNKLESVETIAKNAVKNTLRRLDARKIATQRCPVIFEARVAKSLLSNFIGAISGGALYRESSFLLNQLNNKIFPSNINIFQRPHLKSAIGSAPFDDQGVVTRDIDYVTDGILKSYVLGAYSAKKLGLTTTGNAGGVYNLFISTENKSLNDLCREMGKGLLITDLMGQGVNILTGDYSRGATGFWVENGEIQYPVHEITVASNLKNMFAQIVAVGNDVDRRGNINTGSILLSEMMVAGM